jgi:hypothetical protein
LFNQSFSRRIQPVQHVTFVAVKTKVSERRIDMNFKSKMLKRGAFGLIFGAMVVGAGAAANAQGDSQKHERRDLKDHQRQERRYNGNDHQTRDHQRLERDQLKYEQRLEHNGAAVQHGQNNNGYYNGGYNNGHYNNSGYNNRGNYGNNSGYYGNDPYYNNGHSNNGSYRNDPYYNNRRSNGSYYGNGRYNRPHRDSRNPIRRAIHHARGRH